MRRGARLVVVAAVLVAAILALASCSVQDGVTSPGYVSGDGTVTEFKNPTEPLELVGSDLEGQDLDIKEFRDQVLVINTWYAACPPCREEAPDLVALDAKEGVQVIGINVRDDAPTALAFERNFGVEYPSILDKDGKAIASLQGLVAINAVPTTLILNGKGQVTARIIGRADASTLNALVESAAK